MPKIKDLDPVAAKAKRKERRAKRAASKKENKPKRPATAFFIFSADFREAVKATLPGGAPVAEISKALGERWRRLPENEKAVYVTKAEADKVRYEREIREYESRQSTLAKQF